MTSFGVGSASLKSRAEPIRMRDEKTSIAHQYIALKRGSIALAGALGEAACSTLNAVSFQAAPIILSPRLVTLGKSFWVLFGFFESVLLGV